MRKCLTTARYPFCDECTNVAQREPGTGIRSVDSDSNTCMKCFNNGWKQRYRDLNAAMKIFRLQERELEQKVPDF
jgi:RNase P subunit RPR2